MNNNDYYWNFTWSSHLILAFLKLFSFTSFNNLIAISLERLHATFRPFKHRFVKKWVYGVIIIVIWLIPVAREVAQIVLVEKSSTINFNATLYFPFYLIFPILICSCYILIVTKIRYSRHPRHHGSVNKRERKLTGTSLIVALISLLCMLPAIIITGLRGFNSQSLSYISFELYFHIYEIGLVWFLANSLINPIIYALRIPGFRAGVSRIFRGATANRVNAQG